MHFQTVLTNINHWGFQTVLTYTEITEGIILSWLTLESQMISDCPGLQRLAAGFRFVLTYVWITEGFKLSWPGYESQRVSLTWMWVTEDFGLSWLLQELQSVSHCSDLQSYSYTRAKQRFRVVLTFLQDSFSWHPAASTQHLSWRNCTGFPFQNILNIKLLVRVSML